MKKLLYLSFIFLFQTNISAQNIIPFSQFDKWGFVDTQFKKVIITPQFKEVKYYSNQILLVKNEDNYVFINKEGKTINEKKFCFVGEYSENMIDFLEDCEKGKYGFADNKGQILITPQYSKVSPFKEGLAAVFQDKNWQYINFRGQKIIQIPDSFSVAYPFKDNYAIIGKNISYTFNQQYTTGNFQIINKQGKTIVDTRKITQQYQKNTPNFNPLIQFNYIKQIKDNLAVIASINDTFAADNEKNGMEIFEALINLNNNTFIELPQKKSIEIINAKLYKVEAENINVYAFQPYSNKPFLVIQNAKKIGQFQENRLPFANQSGDWGYTDETGKEVIPAKYTYVSPYLSGKAIVQEKNKMLVMLDKNGEAINIDKKGTITKTYFDVNVAMDTEREVFVVKFAKRFGLINMKNNSLPFGLFAYGFDSLLVDNTNFPYYVKKQKGWAMLKDNDKNILPNLYQSIQPLPINEVGFVSNYFSFLKQNDRYAIYNIDGNICSDFIFDKLEFTAIENIFLATIAEKKHLINIVGKILLENIEQIKSIKYNHFIVQKNGKVALIDANFKEILPFGYEKLEWYDNNNIYATQNGKIGLFKLSENKFLLPCEYTSIGNLREKYVTIQQGQKFGLMEKTTQGFKMAFPAEYQDIKLTIFEKEKYFVVKKNDKLGLLNMELTTILPTEYDFINSINNYGSPLKYLIVQKNKLFGYTDKFGKTVISCQYEKIDLFRSFANGWAFAKKNGFWGAIDTLNQIKIPFEYDSLENRYPEKKLVSFDAKKNKKWGVIDDVNQILIPIQYDELGRVYFEDDVPFGIQVKQKWGFADKQNKILVKPQFEDAKQPFESKQLNAKNPEKSFIACVKKKGKWGLIDMKGKKIIDFKFDEIEYSSPKGEYPIRAKLNQNWFYVNWKGEMKEKE
ncbi:MAG: WG repeat-containing protein [Cytophagales bacterium]|nr:MAG: WG repeat-containing protein [Cytophagales bacterium]